MRVVVVGTGTIGSAVQKVLKEHGHEVVSIGRNSGDFQADISDQTSLTAVFSRIGRIDAVACAAGDVFPGPFEQLTGEQWAKSIAGKGMGQINLVRAALPHVADKGSFTLVSGVLTDVMKIMDAVQSDTEEGQFVAFASKICGPGESAMKMKLCPANGCSF